MGTQNINLTLPPFNSASWNQPVNSNFEIIDKVFGSTANVAISGTQTNLKPEDIQSLRINLSGNQGPTNSVVLFPSGSGGSWIVSNNVATTGGKLYVGVAGGTVNPIEVTSGTSIYVFSDRSNLYTIAGPSGGGGGATGNYLPLTGGTITGDLGVDKTMSVGGDVTMRSNLVVTKSIQVADLKVSGTFQLPSTNLSVPTIAVGGAVISGQDALAVKGGSNLGGDVSVAGNLRVASGSLTVGGSGASSSTTLNGVTTVPANASFTISSGATFRVENGAQLSLSGTFTPSSLSTGDIASSTKITVTGSGGVNAGAGGVTTTGAINFGSLKGNGDIVTSGAVGADKGLFTAGGITCNNTITLGASGWANIQFLPYGTKNGTLNDDGARIGFFNRTLGQSALLDCVTGKWTATGGVGIGVSGSVAQALAAWCPSAVYRQDGREGCPEITAVDLEDVLLKLVEEIAGLRSELAAIKG